MHGAGLPLVGVGCPGLNPNLEAVPDFPPGAEMEEGTGDAGTVLTGR